jgi:hypothetical protein
MTFARAWVLLFAAAPLVWVVMSWHKTFRRWNLLLKGLALALVLVAVAEPVMNVSETKMAVAIHTDQDNRR